MKFFLSYMDYTNFISYIVFFTYVIIRILFQKIKFAVAEAYSFYAGFVDVYHFLENLQVKLHNSTDVFVMPFAFENCQTAFYINGA